MKVNVETLSPIEKKLSVEIDPERVEQEIERAYRGLSQRVRLPGFRPGKVPRRILEARFRDQVEQDVVQHLVEHSYLEAIASHDFVPVAPPVISPEKLERGKAFRYEARVEVKPKVEAKDYKGLEYTPSSYEVTDQMVEDELNRLREQFAEFVPVEDRKVGIAGDYAVISYRGTLDGEEIAGAKGEGITVRIEEGSLLDGRAPMLAGVEVGQTVTTDVTFPEDYSVESLRGKTAQFEVKLEALKAREVPELDDEFAKDLGGKAKTLAELRQEVRESLERSLGARARRENREKIQKALVEKNPIEVPPSMIENGIDHSIAQTLERFRSQGIDPRALNLDFRRIREELRDEVTLRIKAALLLESVVEQEGIEVADADLEAHYSSLAEELGTSVETIRKHYELNRREREALVERLKEEKAVELLLREAKAV